MIHKSIIFAAEAHNGQLRKGTKLPYIIHPMEVAQILSYQNASEEIIVAGILHDVLEDTDVTYQDLVHQFGEYIATLVSECSSDNCNSWRTRKQHTLDKIHSSDNQDVVLIMCADKISNLRSIVYDVQRGSQEVWERFSAPKNDVLWYYDQLFKEISNKPGLPIVLVREYAMLYLQLQKMLNDK